MQYDTASGAVMNAAHPQPVNTQRGSRAYAVRLDLLLAYIVRYSKEHQRPPTFREIIHALGLSSTSVVKYQLGALEQRGDITLTHGIARGISVNRPITNRRGATREHSSGIGTHTRPQPTRKAGGTSLSA